MNKYEKQPDMTLNNRYPGFDYSANQLARFIATTDFFTILLTSGEVIHFFPDDVRSFYEWLITNNVVDMRSKKS